MDDNMPSNYNDEEQLWWSLRKTLTDNLMVDDAETQYLTAVYILADMADKIGDLSSRSLNTTVDWRNWIQKNIQSGGANTNSAWSRAAYDEDTLADLEIEFAKFCGFENKKWTDLFVAKRKNWQQLMFLRQRIPTPNTTRKLLRNPGDKLGWKTNGEIIWSKPGKSGSIFGDNNSAQDAIRRCMCGLVFFYAFTSLMSKKRVANYNMLGELYYILESGDDEDTKRRELKTLRAKICNSIVNTRQNPLVTSKTPLTRKERRNFVTSAKRGAKFSHGMATSASLALIKAFKGVTVENKLSSLMLKRRPIITRSTAPADGGITRLTQKDIEAVLDRTVCLYSKWIKKHFYSGTLTDDLRKNFQDDCRQFRKIAWQVMQLVGSDDDTYTIRDTLQMAALTSLYGAIIADPKRKPKSKNGTLKYTRKTNIKRRLVTSGLVEGAQKNITENTIYQHEQTDRTMSQIAKNRSDVFKGFNSATIQLDAVIRILEAIQIQKENDEKTPSQELLYELIRTRYASQRFAAVPVLLQLLEHNAGKLSPNPTIIKFHNDRIDHILKEFKNNTKIKELLNEINTSGVKKAGSLEALYQLLITEPRIIEFVDDDIAVSVSDAVKLGLVNDPLHINILNKNAQFNVPVDKTRATNFLRVFGEYGGPSLVIWMIASFSTFRPVQTYSQVIRTTQRAVRVLESKHFNTMRQFLNDEDQLKIETTGPADQFLFHIPPNGEVTLVKTHNGIVKYIVPALNRKFGHVNPPAGSTNYVETRAIMSIIRRAEGILSPDGTTEVDQEDIRATLKRLIRLVRHVLKSTETAREACASIKRGFGHIFTKNIGLTTNKHMIQNAVLSMMIIDICGNGDGKISTTQKLARAYTEPSLTKCKFNETGRTQALEEEKLQGGDSRVVHDTKIGSPARWFVFSYTTGDPVQPNSNSSPYDMRDYNIHQNLQNIRGGGRAVVQHIADHAGNYTLRRNLMLYMRKSHRKPKFKNILTETDYNILINDIAGLMSHKKYEVTARMIKNIWDEQFKIELYSSNPGLKYLDLLVINDQNRESIKAKPSVLLKRLLGTDAEVLYKHSNHNQWVETSSLQLFTVENQEQAEPMNVKYAERMLPSDLSIKPGYLDRHEWSTSPNRTNEYSCYNQLVPITMKKKFLQTVERVTNEKEVIFQVVGISGNVYKAKLFTNHPKGDWAVTYDDYYGSDTIDRLLEIQHETPILNDIAHHCSVRITAWNKIIFCGHVNMLITSTIAVKFKKFRKEGLETSIPRWGSQRFDQRAENVQLFLNDTWKYALTNLIPAFTHASERIHEMIIEAMDEFKTLGMDQEIAHVWDFMKWTNCMQFLEFKRSPDLRNKARKFLKADKDTERADLWALMCSTVNEWKKLGNPKAPMWWSVYVGRLVLKILKFKYNSQLDMQLEAQTRINMFSEQVLEDVGLITNDGVIKSEFMKDISRNSQIKNLRNWAEHLTQDPPEDLQKDWWKTFGSKKDLVDKWKGFNKDPITDVYLQKLTRLAVDSEEFSRFVYKCMQYARLRGFNWPEEKADTQQFDTTTAQPVVDNLPYDPFYSDVPSFPDLEEEKSNTQEKEGKQEVVDLLTLGKTPVRVTQMSSQSSSDSDFFASDFESFSDNDGGSDFESFSDPDSAPAGAPAPAGPPRANFNNSTIRLFLDLYHNDNVSGATLFRTLVQNKRRGKFADLYDINAQTQKLFNTVLESVAPLERKNIKEFVDAFLEVVSNPKSKSKNTITILDLEK